MSSDPSSESISDELRSLALSSPFVQTWFNGIATCITLTALHALYTGKDTSPRKYTWSFIVILLYTSSTIQLGLDWATTVNPIIDFGGTPELFDALGNIPPWVEALADTLFSLNILVADIVFIWRCWVVWERRWIVTILPILATLAGFVLNVLSLIGQNEAALISVSAGNPNPGAESLIRFSTPYLILSMSTTVYTTCMIIWRILFITTRIREAGIKRSLFGRYMGIIEILVESAALYTLTILIFVILILRSEVNSPYPDVMLSQISCISPTLIILRVALGHARVDRHTTKYTPTSLAFASNVVPTQNPTTQNNSEEYDAMATSDGSTKLTSLDFQASLVSKAEDLSVQEKV